MTEPRKRIDVTPEQAYAIVVGALDVFASMSPGVNARIVRDFGPDGKGYGKFPTVDPRALLTLRTALEDARPGIVVDVIERTQADRLATRRAARGEK
jgi:hypothetical protein